MKPLSALDLDAIGSVYEGFFYRCRDGSVVGPLVNDGREPSYGYKAAIGDRCNGEWWDSDGWCHGIAEPRARDLVEQVSPPLTWTGSEWIVAKDKLEAQ